MAPSRRALLAALGATFAGCSADPSRSQTATTNSETRSPTDSSTETDTGSPTPDPSTPDRVELDDDRVRWREDPPAGRVVGLTAAGDALYVGTNNQSGLTPEPDEPE